ncbi:MAG: hypothetical protein QM520_00595 [Gammaproteobacteria bacterium]|nr:hypothetical protein [Gammaproteobacteria bacterium]
MLWVFIFLVLLTLLGVLWSYWRVLKPSHNLSQSPESLHAPEGAAKDSMVSQLPSISAMVKFNKSMSWVLSFMLPVVAIGLYLKYGTPQAIDHHPSAQKEQMTPEKLNQLAEQLDARLAINEPTNAMDRAEAYAFLGKIRHTLGQWEKSKEAFVKSLTIEDNPDIQIQLAESLAQFQQGSFAGEPWKIIQSVLSQIPDHIGGLWLAGQASYTENKHRQAIEFWTKAQTQVKPNDEEFALLQQAIEQATVSLNNSPYAFISGNLTIDKSILSQLSPDQFVFIYALNNTADSGMPLAVKKISLHQLPYAFRLDDSLSLVANRKLSQVNEVQLVARISKSDKIDPHSDDWGVRLHHIKLGQENIQLVIRKKLSE